MPYAIKNAGFEGLFSLTHTILPLCVTIAVFGLIMNSLQHRYFIGPIAHIVGGELYTTEPRPLWGLRLPAAPLRSSVVLLGITCLYGSSWL